MQTRGVKIGDILSLRREGIERLGCNHAAQWKIFFAPITAKSNEQQTVSAVSRLIFRIENPEDQSVLDLPLHTSLAVR